MASWIGHEINSWFQFQLRLSSSINSALYFLSEWTYFLIASSHFELLCWPYSHQVDQRCRGFLLICSKRFTIGLSRQHSFELPTLTHTEDNEPPIKSIWATNAKQRPHSTTQQYKIESGETKICRAWSGQHFVLPPRGSPCLSSLPPFINFQEREKSLHQAIKTTTTSQGSSTQSVAPWSTLFFSIFVWI